VLWTDEGPHFVEFDDARNGPAVQDVWMLLSGDRHDVGKQMGHVLDGYEQSCDFDRRELNLIEAQRTLRLLHYSITRFARPSSDCGIVRPRALAVLRLMTNSNVVGRSMGRSPGFAPRKILSTWRAAPCQSAVRLAP